MRKWRKAGFEAQRRLLWREGPEPTLEREREREREKVCVSEREREGNT